MSHLSRKSYINPSVVTNALFVAGVAIVIGTNFGAPLLWGLSGLSAGIVIALLVEAPMRLARYDGLLFRFRLLLMVCLEALAVIFLLMPFVLVYTRIHPSRYEVGITPDDVGLVYEDALFTTSDGVILRGWYLPSRNGAVVITLHGANGNRTHTLPHGQVLHEADYGVLMFDMRAHGESGGDTFPIGSSGDVDLQAAVDWLHAQEEDLRLGVLGLSAGGHLALEAEQVIALEAYWVDGVESGNVEDFIDPVPPEDPSPLFVLSYMDWLRGVITGYPPQSIRQQIQHITPRPVMIVAGNSSYERLQAQKYAVAGGENVIVWELDTGHISGLVQYPALYSERMLDFFNAALLNDDVSTSN